MRLNVTSVRLVRKHEKLFALISTLKLLIFEYTG